MSYRISHEERSIFWEVIVSVILSKKVYKYMCFIASGFRDVIAHIKEGQDALRRVLHYAVI
jgi:hypothetical protein